jgi:thiosulfate/3-mercaptopyruvate sulfurtransferase
MKFTDRRAKLGVMPFQTLIDAGALQDLLGDPRLAILDCRTDLLNPQAGLRDYSSGHIPAAVHVDLNRDLSGPVTARSGRHPLPTPQAFAVRLGLLGVSNDSQVVAYDTSNGVYAARLWWMLRWVGHTSVAILDGGLQSWLAAGGALQAGGTAQCNSLFLTRIAAEAVVSSAEVIQALRDPQVTLTDARAAERFSGSVEPIDPVAGHVPGAVNHPFSLNLGASGRFLPAAELRRRWLARLAGKPSDKLIAMCGSGVTACHNLLSLELAGLSGGKLYAGSWSEWSRNPQRPVATG